MASQVYRKSNQAPMSADGKAWRGQWLASQEDRERHREVYYWTTVWLLFSFHFLVLQEEQLLGGVT
jgi:hypothetical protein